MICFALFKDSVKAGPVERLEERSCRPTISASCFNQSPTIVNSAK